jgi:microcompartment protein CcmK/EutM
VKVGTVVGTVVSTINHELFDHRRLLLCDIATPVGLDRQTDAYTIAVDLVDAGVGDTVLVLDEGTSARQLLGVETGPIRAVIVGIVDEWYDAG